RVNGPMLESALPVVRAPDGRFHAVPFNYITDVQFIRTDLFRKAGAKVPTTWEEVREAARLIKAKGVMEYPLGQSWNRSADGYGVFQALLYSHGGGWADEQGNYTSIMNDTWRAVVRWASEIYLKDKTVPPDAMSWTGFGNNEAFLTGKVAFTFNGPSIYYVLEKENRPILKDTLMAVKPAGPAGRAGAADGRRRRGRRDQRPHRPLRPGHRRRLGHRARARGGRQADQGHLRERPGSLTRPIHARRS